LRRHILRRLDAIFLIGRCLRVRFLPIGNFGLSGYGVSRRLGIVFAGNLDRFLEVLDIKPSLGTEAFLNAILP
jgi:hypothetical protein